MTVTAEIAHSCRCGCGSSCRGLFAPGHDARYKGQLARDLCAAYGDDNRERYDFIRDACDGIDREYGRAPGKWWGLVTKQADRMRAAATGTLVTRLPSERVDMPRRSRGLWGCGGCDNRWSGANIAHCSVCHQTFGGPSGFDKHRKRGTCVSPETLGMVLNPNSIWVTPSNGVDFASLFHQD